MNELSIFEQSVRQYTLLNDNLKMTNSIVRYNCQAHLLQHEFRSQHETELLCEKIIGLCYYFVA